MKKRVRENKKGEMREEKRKKGEEGWNEGREVKVRRKRDETRREKGN